MDKSAAWLKQSLDYEFTNEQLLQQALTHRSAPGINNERLEYLGDAVLDFIISEAVYLQRPDASEGVLSRLRSSLVKDATLAELAIDLGVGEHLILGSGEKKVAGTEERRYWPMLWKQFSGRCISIPVSMKRNGLSKTRSQTGLWRFLIRRSGGIRRHACRSSCSPGKLHCLITR